MPGFCSFSIFLALYELSQILNTGLDRTTLGVLTQLCEAGVNPEALAQVVKEMGVEARAFALAHEASLNSQATSTLGLQGSTAPNSVNQSARQITHAPIHNTDIPASARSSTISETSSSRQSTLSSTSSRFESQTLNDARSRDLDAAARR